MDKRKKKSHRNRNVGGQGRVRERPAPRSDTTIAGLATAPGPRPAAPSDSSVQGMADPLPSPLRVASPRPAQRPPSGRRVSDSESALAEILTVTYSFDPAPAPAVQSFRFRIDGVRLGVSGRRRPGDRFRIEEVVEDVPAGSGPVTITTRVHDVNPGRWDVTATMIEATGPGAEASRQARRSRAVHAGTAGSSPFSRRTPQVHVRRVTHCRGRGLRPDRGCRAAHGVRDRVTPAAHAPFQSRSSGRLAPVGRQAMPGW